MKLRNLKIDDCDIENKELVEDSVRELDIIISDNYKLLGKKEVAIEFNIGSRLGEQTEHLVVYSNPDYVNNPYIFILKTDINTKERFLTDRTSLVSFQDLSDLYTRQNVHHTLVVGFKNLPKHAFLSQNQICEARKLALSHDLKIK